MIFKTTKLIIGLLGAGFLAACTTSPIPVSENFPLTVQPKVRSAGHWNILSKDIITQTLNDLSKADKPLKLYVGLPEKASQFDIAFKEFLITELVKSGNTVQKTPENAIEVSYQAQIIVHKAPRPHFVPGGFTMLTTGLYALYGLGDLGTHTGSALGMLGVAVAADAIASVDSGGPTHTEMILTTTASKGGSYLSRKTNVYYVEEEDASLFSFAGRSPTILKVVGVK